MNDSADARRREFGDFQTPDALAAAVCRTLRRWRIRPATVIEPTCGRGALLAAAAHTWPTARLVGFDIDRGYVAAARRALPYATIEHADAFRTDWHARLATLPEPWLVLGNPPWVTNAALATLGSGNRPARANPERRRGIDAITGRSNFDVSEWITRTCIDAAAGRRAAVAMLLKTSVARRVLRDVWREGRSVRDARIVGVDAAAAFGARVAAGLLFLRTDRRGTAIAEVRERLDASPVRRIGLGDGELVADFDGWHATQALATDRGATWRSGVKHDCAAVFELREADGAWMNGIGERVDVEPEVVYPLLKSADLAHDAPPTPRRHVLLPQRTLGEDPARLAALAPRAWAYLMRHAARLDARASRIYRDRPRFSVFGVGDYTLASHKVAIAGLYATPRFHAIAPIDGRPVVADDTVYFHPCPSRRAALALARELNAEPARTFFTARLFADAKRPVTAALLGRYGGSKRDGADACRP